MHPKSIIMRFGKQVGSRKGGGASPAFLRFLVEKLYFWSHFGRQLDFEGGPKIAFLVIMLEKNEENEVRERFREKHEILMDF